MVLLLIIIVFHYVVAVIIQIIKNAATSHEEQQVDLARDAIEEVEQGPISQCLMQFELHEE